jgi:hypothetical protein
MAKKMIRNLLTFLLSFMLLAGTAGAYVASSTNYRLQSDSINFGGGLSNSDNYNLESTGGEVASGRSSSGTYSANAGFQEMQEVYLAVSGPTTVDLGTVDRSAATFSASASGDWTVVTDNPAGYNMSLRASTNPALRSSDDSFANYSGTTFAWAVAESESAFGFSPEGDDVVSSFLDNGSSCGVGILDTADSCWAGIGTSNTAIASAGDRTSVAGTVTTLKLKAEIGSEKLSTQTIGNYQASLVVTVLAE